MKELKSLGKILSKKEQKMIIGGDEDPGFCNQGSCSSGDNCSSLGHGCACRDVVGTEAETIQVCKTGR